MADVNAGAFQTVAQLGTEIIVAGASDHRNGRAEFRNSDGLVGALPAVKRCEVVSGDRFSRERQAISTNDEIEIDATDNNDGLGHEGSIRYLPSIGAMAIDPKPRTKKINIAGIRRRDTGGA